MDTSDEVTNCDLKEGAWWQALSALRLHRTKELSKLRNCRAGAPPAAQKLATGAVHPTTYRPKNPIADNRQHGAKSPEFLDNKKRSAVSAERSGVCRADNRESGSDR
jgi:hypothetical protein